MQGLVNFSTAIADTISTLLPAALYLAACGCFFFAAWTLRGLANGDQRHRHRPWVVIVSLIMAGIFASFPDFLTMTGVSVGTNERSFLYTFYQSTVAPNAGNILGATPQNTVINVVTLFQYFFQMFGAACVFWALYRWRALVIGDATGSKLSCGIQFVFGVMCINILTVANGVVAFFQTGG